MKKTTSGFTIVELLIVIVIIAILAAITIVTYNGIQARSADSIVKSDLASFAKKMELFKIDNSSYPKTVAELDSLGFKFTKAAYSTGPSGAQRNAMYCRYSDTTGYTLLAKSNSGSNFAISHNSMTATSIGITWNSTTTAFDLCASLGSPYDGNNRNTGYTYGLTPTEWASWTGNAT